MTSSPISGTILQRLFVFALASSSIVCLMADLYGVCPMRFFAPWIFCPALVGLVGWALADWVCTRRCRKALAQSSPELPLLTRAPAPTGSEWDGRRAPRQGWVSRIVWIGLAGGFVAALAYDIFRLPFVYARQWHLAAVVPPLDLFKVFPRFGAMILGQPLEQPGYSMAARVLGWLYHFSNGATFGVMYLALVGSPARVRWPGTVLFALALELGMLLTPYPARFHVPMTPSFIAATAAAHALFGLILGWSIRGLAAGGVRNSEPPSGACASCA